jgi:hypothetical protein
MRPWLFIVHIIREYLKTYLIALKKAQMEKGIFLLVDAFFSGLILASKKV